MIPHHIWQSAALGILLLGALASSVGAKAEAETESAPDKANESSGHTKRTSAELRFTIISPSGRWSRVDFRNETLATHSKRSLYFGPGIGARIFIKQPHHGLLADFDYRVDTDVDSINSLSKWKTDFAVARVGYAYRFIRHANEKMVWTFTPHASFSAGGSVDRTRSPVFSRRSAVLGGRVGVNVDFHIQRFFMGWAVEYEGLRHLVEGPIITSHFLLWTLLPIMRIGVDLGPRLQSLAR